MVYVEKWCQNLTANGATSAKRVDGGYVVNGLKNYCTLATVAKYHGISVGIEGKEGPASYLHVPIPTDHPGAEIDTEWWPAYRHARLR